MHGCERSAVTVVRYAPPDIGRSIREAYDLLAQDADTKSMLDCGAMRLGISLNRMDESGIITLRAWFGCSMPGMAEDEIANEARIEKELKYLPCGDGTAVLDGVVMTEERVVVALTSLLVSFGGRLALEIRAMKR